MAQMRGEKERRREREAELLVINTAGLVEL